MRQARTLHNEMPADLSRILEEESAAEQTALRNAWEAAGRPLDGEPTEDDLVRLGGEAWSVIDREIRRGERPARPRRRRTLWRWTAVAASLFAATLSALFYLTWEQTITAPPGDRLTLTLPDGSAVELNSGASLTFAPRTFGWFSRTTALEGEAYFEVVTHESAFVARTFNAEVRVLGTSFNVRAWPGESAGATVVALRTGAVRLSSRIGTERAVVLRPGEMSRVDKRNKVPTQPEATDLSQATAWRTGRFVFVDEPLSAILDEMERRFDVSIRADAEDILDDRLTLAYDSPASADAILEDIASSYSRYSYRSISGGYELYVP